MGTRRLVPITIALGVGLLLADASIVVLALPDLLAALHTTVLGVASVLFVYVGGLAAATAIPFERRADSPHVAAVGFGVVALASAVAAVAGSLSTLLLARVLAAGGAGAAIRGGFHLIDGGGAGRRPWTIASLAGSAVGPALGGALTQAFDWRAIFVVQIPVVLAAAIASWSRTAAPAPPSTVPEPTVVRGRPALTAGLALVAAALTTEAFLLVLILVAGWDISPLAAAASLTVLPIAALAGSRLPGSARRRAVLGSLMVGGSALALARLPDAGIGWTIPAQLLAGVGAGMALPALAGELLPERTAAQAARLISTRSIATALLLIVIAPVLANRITSAAHTAELRGVALVLDARLSPQTKFRLVPRLLAAVRTQEALASLRAALQRGRGSVSGSERAAYDRFAADAESVLVAAIRDGFAPGLLAAGACGLLAAVLLAAALRPRAVDRTAVAAVAASILLPLVYFAVPASGASPPITVAAACAGGTLPGSGGITGFLQDRAIQLLDATACQLHTSRAELVLAAASPDEARRFAAAHGGLNPHSIISTVEDVLSSL